MDTSVASVSGCHETKKGFINEKKVTRVMDDGSSALAEVWGTNDGRDRARLTDIQI